MSINPTLNSLAELALIACDDSYFMNTSKTRPIGGDSDPTLPYKDEAQCLPTC